MYSRTHRRSGSSGGYGHHIEDGLGGDEDGVGDQDRLLPHPVVIPRADRVSLWRQFVSSAGFCMGAFAMGNTLGWSSTALPDLVRDGC